VTDVDVTGLETGDPRSFNIRAISAGLTKKENCC